MTPAHSVAKRDPAPVPVFPLRLAAGRDWEDEDGAYSGAGQSSAAHEDLPYKVELWNEGKTAVDVVLAVTANSSIGYAAYYAAAREYPERYVTFRHLTRTLAKSNGPDR